MAAGVGMGRGVEMSARGEVLADTDGTDHRDLGRPNTTERNVATG